MSILREEIKGRICVFLDRSLEETFKKVLEAADKNLSSDFWTALDNMTKLLDLEMKSECRK